MGESRVTGIRTPPPPPGKSQLATGFLKNTGTDAPPDAIGPSGEVSTALCVIS